MDSPVKIKTYSFTLDCADAHALARFYAALLNWEVGFHDEDYAWAFAPGTQQGAYPCLLFQKNPAYKPPVWPDTPEAQQQMAHIDFAVNDLDASVQYALHCGATMADEQFSDDWRVMLDPAGHPFCLCRMTWLYKSEHFALL